MVLLCAFSLFIYNLYILCGEIHEDYFICSPSTFFKYLQAKLEYNNIIHILCIHNLLVAEMIFVFRSTGLVVLCFKSRK